MPVHDLYSFNLAEAIARQTQVRLVPVHDCNDCMVDKSYKYKISMPFLLTRFNNFSDAPAGFFSPVSHF